MTKYVYLKDGVCYTCFMKNEEEYSSLFLTSGNFKESETATDLSKNYWSDLTSHIRGYFTHEDREAITIKAGQKLRQEIEKGCSLQDGWPNVIRDFIKDNQWGYSTTKKKPEKKQTEEQKIFWKLFRYAWAFFQSMVILKIAVYYFGLESAQDNSEISPIWVWVFFALSAGSLSFFAYRNWNEKD